MPSAKDVLRTFPLCNNHHELSALGLDVIAAHKRVVIKESHRGLLGISHRNAIYFYKVAPFGAIFSAHWWGRLGSFWVRFLHQAIFVAHALFLFVEDFMLIQRKDVLPLAAAFVCSLMQVFGLPISWRKVDLHWAIDWIGWRFNVSIGAIYLQERKRSKLLELISQMISHSHIPKKTLEKFLGLALWIIRFFRRCDPVCVVSFQIFIDLQVRNTQWTRVIGPLQFLVLQIHCIFRADQQVQLYQRAAN